jgi:epimerase EvaD
MARRNDEEGLRMRARALAVEGAVEFTPPTFPDHRGVFVSPFQSIGFESALGRPSFPVAQTNVSISRAGVVRGVHFTAVPPGAGKYTYCVRGRALDIVVDLRLGSPTFGRSDTVAMDGDSFRAVYLPIGVGHAFVAIEDGTIMCYLMSENYSPETERTVSVLDPGLALPVPPSDRAVMSERDLGAPSLEEAERRGLLPSYLACLRIDGQNHGGPEPDRAASTGGRRPREMEATCASCSQR